MNDQDQQPSGLTRRTVTRAAAWSVPAIALAAAVPAYAASGSTEATATGECLPGREPDGRIVVALGTIPTGAQVQVTLTSTGSGTFTATPDPAFVGPANGPYVITGTGTTFTGNIDLLFALGHNGSDTVTATVVGLDGFVVTGKTTSFVFQRRDGNSQNYNQCSAG